MLREVGDANPLLSILEEKRDFTPCVDALLSWGFPDIPSREELTQIHARLAVREYTSYDLDELLNDYKTRPALAKMLLMVYFAGSGILFKRIPKPNYSSAGTLLGDFENFLDAYRNYRKREDEFLACTSMELDEIKRDLDERVTSIAKQWTTRLGLENANWLSLPNPTLVTLFKPFAEKRAQETLFLSLVHWNGKEYEAAMDLALWAAEQGLVSAMCEYGGMRLNTELPQNQDKKIHASGDRWIKLAVTCGDPVAILRLGIKIYKEGKKSDALNWIFCSAQKGNRIAQFHVYELLTEEKEEKEAIEWLRKSAEQGLLMGLRELGKRMFQGKGIPKDQERGLKFLRGAAEQGDADAQSFLGRLYLTAGNKELAEVWFTKGAAQKDIISALELGGIVEERGEVENAKKYYQIAATEGNYEASRRLGVIQLREGEEELGLKNLENAGSKGNMQAYVDFADYVFRKKTTDNRTIKKACEYLKKAADRDNVASFNLSGTVALNGGEWGNNKESTLLSNPELALYYFKLAADKADGNGEHNMGLMTLWGFNGKKDERAALDWFKKALSHGYEPARVEIDKLLQQYPHLQHPVDENFDAVLIPNQE